jgi:hypothetical protein
VSDFDEMGIVRHRRWLAYGFHHGWQLRPVWLRHLIVTAWNRVACTLFGHEWVPEIDVTSDEPALDPDREYCPNCCDQRETTR